MPSDDALEAVEIAESLLPHLRRQAVFACVPRRSDRSADG